jgi:hypothetical protein
VGNGDVLNIVVHKNVWLSEVIVSGILDSHHLPVVFHILGHVRTRNLSGPVDKFTNLKWFQSLAFELISSRIKLTQEEADKVARDFTASIASAYRLSTSRLTLSDLNKDLPDLESLQQVTRDPTCKMAVNWVTKTIRGMTHRKAFELWD